MRLSSRNNTMSPTWMRHDTWRISADLQNSQWTTVSKNDGLEPNTGSIDEVLLLTDTQKEDLANDFLRLDVWYFAVDNQIAQFYSGRSSVARTWTCCATIVDKTKVSMKSHKRDGSSWSIDPAESGHLCSL